MDIITAIMVYFVVWWTVIFCVLPWGIRRDAVLGTGAPEVPLLRKKFIATTILSFVVLALIQGAIKLNLIDFRAISRNMAAEDFKTVDTGAPIP